MIQFAFDQLTDQGIGYPNLAQHRAEPLTPEWRNFDHHWPRTVPLRLLTYLSQADIQHQSVSVRDSGNHAWYPIGLGWFDFDLDYFALLDPVVLSRLKAKTLRVLFYYHEGDNPVNIKQRLDHLVKIYRLDPNCYKFVSANTASQNLENFVYFCDHEHFFRYINRKQTSLLTHQPKTHVFTILNRTHKWWRAAAMSYLDHHKILEHSLWSYNRVYTDDNASDNPLEIDLIPEWRSWLEQFMNKIPAHCDGADTQQHNDHQCVNTDLYSRSWCHVIFETHFDADQSDGVFLTEKTWKCIKYQQPFVMVGPTGSVQELRNQGYRVFDNLIDHGYDNIKDNTQRWLAVANTLKNLVKIKDFESWYQACRADLEHNQNIFGTSLESSVNKLLEGIYGQHR